MRREFLGFKEHGQTIVLGGEARFLVELPLYPEHGLAKFSHIIRPQLESVLSIYHLIDRLESCRNIKDRKCHKEAQSRAVDRGGGDLKIT